MDQFDVPITVASQLAPPPTTGASPAPSPSGSPDDTPSPTSPQPEDTTDETDSETLLPLTQEQRIAQIATQLDAQPTVLSCATLNLSQDRITQLRTQATRLNTREFELIRGCFAEINYVVPGAYAPIAPETVKSKDVEESTDTRINDASTQNDTHKDTGAAVTKLRLQGQAKPNSDVLLYVFSEPLVLYAKADDKGNWVYDIVDPLTPGKHEAYAVVETETGTYKKSSPFSFFIETAQASAENPSGYSLSVKTVSSLAATPSKQRSNLYALGAMTLVIVVTLLGLFMVFRTFKHVPDEPTDMTGNEG